MDSIQTLPSADEVLESWTSGRLSQIWASIVVVVEIVVVLVVIVVFAATAASKCKQYTQLYAIGHSEQIGGLRLVVLEPSGQWA